MELVKVLVIVTSDDIEMSGPRCSSNSCPFWFALSRLLIFPVNHSVGTTAVSYSTDVRCVKVNHPLSVVNWITSFDNYRYDEAYYGNFNPSAIVGISVEMEIPKDFLSKYGKEMVVSSD